MKTIAAEQFLTLHRERGDQLTLIDVRSPIEFRALHVHSAINLPLGHISENTLPPHAGKDDEIYLICHSGARSAKAAERMRDLGFTRVLYVIGGITACRECGLPVEMGEPAMSIERQVRIVAGSLVLLGVLLSLFVHPAFVYLSALIGAGLVFAGVSDSCMMGLLLARMPWNR